MLKNEPAANGWVIYVYSYQTGFFSGTYSLNDVVDDLKERFLIFDHLGVRSFVQQIPGIGLSPHVY